MKMVKLKTSEIIDKQIGFVGAIDLSVRQYEDGPRILYIGQGSQVIQITEEDLDEFIAFLKEGLSLPLVRETPGWLK